MSLSLRITILKKGTKSLISSRHLFAFQTWHFKLSPPGCVSGHKSSQSEAHSILLSNVTRLRSVVTRYVVKLQCCYATLLHREVVTRDVVNVGK